jgi:hypothetical protein
MTSDSVLWHQYYKYLDQVGAFEGESWITVHASLCWLMDPMYTIYSPSPSIVAQSWQVMTDIRGLLVARLTQQLNPPSKTLSQLIGRLFHLKFLAKTASRFQLSPSMPIMLVPLPSPIKVPWWSPLQISSILLIPVEHACRLVRQFMSLAMTDFFLIDLAVPIGFIRGGTPLYDILLHCHRSDLYALSQQFDIRRPAVSDRSSLFQVMRTSMDLLLSNLRSVKTLLLPQTMTPGIDIFNS